ncbi:MAG: GEVED domain-containing protein [Bacteroidota bacterium]
MNKKCLLKQLLFIPVFLIAGFVTKAQILTQDFESGNFPPTGWLNDHTAGDVPEALWNTETTGAFGGDDATFTPFAVDPHSGTGMVFFDCYTWGSGNAGTLTSSSFSLTTPGAKTVSFWMHRDDGYSDAHDSVSVYINTTTGLAGATLVGVVHRLNGDAPVVTTGSGWYMYTFTIPSTFTTATNYLIFEAMSDFGNNIFIDDISVDEFAACAGTPSAGTITGPSAACPTAQIILENTGATDAAGMSYAWQFSANATGPWTNIAEQTGLNNATTSQTTATYYRFVATCGNGGQSDSSNVIQITVNPSSECYCKPPETSLHSVADDYITNVTIQGTTLNSSNGVDAVTGYTLVPATPASNTADLTQVTSYTITATIVDDGFITQVSCWVDFNGNGSFDANEYTDLALDFTNAVASGTIQVPADAVPGLTGLRIRARAANFADVDVCSTFGSGETEDYVVNIIANTALNGALVDIIPPVAGCNAPGTVSVKLRNSGNQNIAAGAATVALYVSGANPQGPITQTNAALILPGDTATLTFTASFPAAGTNLDSAAIQTLAGDINAADDVITTNHITLPAAVNAPYAEDFEGAVPGWTVSQLAGTGNWFLSDTIYYFDFDPEYKLLPKSGILAAVFDSYNYAAGTVSRLSTNCINIPADANSGCGYVAGFYFTQDAQYNNQDSIVLSASNDGGLTFTRLGLVKRQDSTLTPTLAQQTGSIPEWRLYTFDIGQYAGTTVQFTLDAYSEFGNQMAIDSFFVGPKAVGGNVGLVSAQETGSALSPSLVQCSDANGWTYYSDSNSARYLFGVQWDPSNTGANAAARAQATAKVTVDRKWYAAENIGQLMATYTMQRYWDVDLDGAAMTGPANVRFFYAQREFDSIIAAKDNFIAANGGIDEGFRWFKTVSGEFIPSGTSVNFDSVVNDLELQNVNTTGATINGILYAQFNGINSFSGGTAASGVGPSTPLPVGLLAFNAQRAAKVNKVTWTTSQEINTDKFIVERSTDGRNFTAIGEVAAAGNSSNNISYSYIDYTPAMGVNFYRLKVIERNGSLKYSAVRSVRNEGTADIAIYPNPVKGMMMLNITSDRIDKAIVTISDMNGRLVQVRTNAINEGSNYININTAALSSGTYIVKIQLNDDMVIRKVNKL